MNICIYHKNCIDGTTAAAIVWSKDKNCALIPLNYNYATENLISITNLIEPDTIIYIVDFSLKENDYEILLKSAKKIINIDHHVGAKDKINSILKKYNNIEYIYDENKSGAGLTLSYFYKDKKSKLVDLVEDRDLWKWKYNKETKYLNSYLYMFINNPKKIEKFLFSDIEDLIKKGGIISEYQDFLVKNFIEKNESIYLKIGNYYIKGYNTQFFQSEIGDILSSEYKIPIALYNISGDNVYISFRSKDGQNPSALELAGLLGGGGHKNAAGTIIPLKKFLSIIDK
jgi:oligoribonuclease NrnB/cAMP/cGMP phosphodiesterase (DHH superfamily)